VGDDDRDAELYDRYWQPVLEPALGRLLERMDGWLDALGAGRGERPAGQPPDPLVIDVGTGTGALLVAAAARWPGARFVGLDPAPGMLRRARLRASAAGLADTEETLRWVAGTADAMPLEDGSVDRAVSSFVLQLVPDRPRVLRELARILRPGGGLAFVTWMAPDMRIEPDDELDEAVLELGIEEREPDPPSATAGDYESAEQAEEELREAGFGSPSVMADALSHAWTRESYLAFKVDFDEASLFEPLDEELRARLLARIRERWARLPDEAFVLRAPIVLGLARRP
jgi:ubiquinone/menaquinone biosynthesis C-methylase UbiE